MPLGGFGVSIIIQFSLEIEALSFAKGWTKTGLTQNQALLFVIRCAWAHAVEVDGATRPFEFRGAGDFGPGS